jgi:predicted HicB family RNase H-like nuclease
MVTALEVGEKEYKGDFLVRTAPSIHRALAMEAALEGVSLNQLCEVILSVGLGRALAKTNR